MNRTYLPEHLPAFVRALEIAEREARALDASWKILSAAPLSPENLDPLPPESDLAVRIEAFAARFGRLQDQVGEKLLPRLLLLLGQTPGPMLDTLNRAERLGILEKALDWLAWRKLRDRLVHEYFQQAALFAEALAQSLVAAPKLTDIVRSVRGYAQKIQAL